MPKSWYCTILLAALAISTPASAKGVTVALSITGPGLDVPLQTSDPEAIDVSIWGGNFAEFENGAVAGPAFELPRYLVHFWAELPRTSTVQLKYVVRFVWDPSEEKALIYLPGPRDVWYRTNTRSILREGEDGKWFYATEPWGKAIRETIHDALQNAS